jgi:hypothetical protein
MSSSNPSLRAQRSNPERVPMTTPLGRFGLSSFGAFAGELDCFAALAMTG